MPAIDWTRVLTTHRIEFVAKGPSTSKGNIYVHCPWCGNVDQGYHLGISLKGKGWGCWRNRNHRGKSPGKLLGALLGVTIDRAFTILGINQSVALESDETLLSFVDKIVHPDQVAELTQEPLLMPKQIKRIDSKGRGQSFMFLEYLQSRGYTPRQAQLVANRYAMHYAMSGAFSYRLIIPIFDVDSNLMTFTGRSIAESASLRYMTLSTDADKAKQNNLPVAREKITDMLLSEHTIGDSIEGFKIEKQRDMLIVCEGPFDAIRVDYAGSISIKRVRATCLFGKSISDRQIDKLAELSELYTHKRLLLDPDAMLDAFQTLQRLASLGFKEMRMPGKWKDPADVPLDVLGELIGKEFVR